MKELSNLEFLSKLRGMDALLTADGDRLRCNAPAEVMTAELRNELAARKSDLLALLREAALESRTQSSLIPRVPRDQKLPLSFGQQRLWFLAQMEGASEAYHLPRGLRLKGKLDRVALRRSLNRILARHEALRTSFSVADGEPVQRIAAIEDTPFPLIEHDLRFDKDARAELDRISELEAGNSFDFTTGPLIRGRLIQLADDEHVLLITMHHIASDGWSISLLANELSALYAAFLSGQGDPLPELEIQYADYAAWQTKAISGEVLEKQASYWKTALAGAPELLELPTDHPRPALQEYDGAYEELVLDEELTAALKDLSRRHRVTLFMTLMAAWAAFLARLSGQQDVLIGTPAADRGRSEVQNLIGFFVNTLVIRLDFSKSPRVSELLKQTKLQTLTALQNQDIPFERIVDAAHPVRSMAHSPLFQVMFAWQNTAEELPVLPGLEVKSLPFPHKSAQFDLTLYLQEEGNVVSGGVEYATALFEPATVQRYLGNFVTMLRGMVADDSQPVSQLPVLPASERQRLLFDLNDTAAEYPREVSLAKLVEDQVERTPDATAVVHGDERLSFRELNSRANQLAFELRKHGAGPDQLVGLFVGRSTQLVLSLLAIVKTGAAYLPLDPMFPPDRLGYMLEDSGAQLLITEDGLTGSLPPFGGTKILLEDKGWRTNSRDNHVVEVKPENLAYLIYTSGSTGKPKGVQVPRGALTNFLWSMREWLQLSVHDRLLAVTTISFDIAGLEMWLPLLVGAQTVVASREAAADGDALRELLKRHDITFLQATPITWQILFQAGWPGKSNLQAACGGEAMPPELASRLVPAVGKVWNLYGPTETTIWSTGYEVKTGKTPVPIGRPLANTQIYILDANKEPVPIGVSGELYIGGDGVADGYLHRPELTAEKFVRDPFREGDMRMYRTGDLARYLPDGTIECLGRTDHQVKLRGFRIELGEIEARLAEHPEVGETVVVAREDSPGNKRLVAYYTTPRAANTEQPGIAVDLLRSHLSAQLPEYMVPAAFVHMDSLPHTPNGKVDRKALPAPATDSFSSHGYEPPQGELETKLAAIWADLLNLDRIGRHDNFFDLGGYSLLAVRVISRVQELIPGKSLPLTALLEAPTVERFAARIQQREKSAQSLLVQIRAGSPQRIPFFCAHATDGSAVGMRPLAMAMDTDIPFYCLEGKGLDGSAPFNSVEENAEFGLREIRKVQPHGPYHLGGYCYGGLVAIEMARMLQELGEQVETLVLIDTYNPAYLWFKPTGEMLQRLLKFYVRRVALHLRKLHSLSSGVWLRYSVGRIKAMFVHFQRFLEKAHPNKDRQLQVNRDAAELKPAANSDFERILERLRDVGPANSRRYKPKPYSGNVLILRVSERNDDPWEDYYLGWKPFIHGPIESFEVEGTHEEILREPAVNEAAGLITAKLRESLDAPKGEPAVYATI